MRSASGGARRLGQSAAWAASRSAATSAATASDGHGPLAAVGRAGRRSPDPSARSRGPTSTRTGTPLSSQSTARRPKDDLHPVVQPDPVAGGAQLVDQRSAAARGVPSSSRTRTTTTWIGRQPGRQAQPGVVAVGHDQRADQAGRGAPRGLPDVLLLARCPRRTGCRRPWRSSGPARGWCPSAGPCRRPSWPRRSRCGWRRRSAPGPSCAR